MEKDYTLLLTVKSVNLRFTEKLTNGAITIHFKYGDVIKKSEKIGVQVGEKDVGKLIKIQAHNCSWGTQLKV